MPTTTTKVALITGATAQDGVYLPEFLLNQGWKVDGIKRRSSPFNAGRIYHPCQGPHETNRKFVARHGDLTDCRSLTRTIQDVQPDEGHSLPAQSYIVVSIKELEDTDNAGGSGALPVMPPRLSEGVRSRCHSTSLPARHRARETRQGVSPHSAGRLAQSIITLLPKPNVKQPHGLEP